MQFSKIFLSETTRPRAFIFGILHHLVVLYKIPSNYAPRVKRALSGGWLVLHLKICWALSKEAFGTIFITSLVWRGRGSNPRPPDYGANALTTEPPLRSDFNWLIQHSTRFNGLIKTHSNVFSTCAVRINARKRRKRIPTASTHFYWAFSTRFNAVVNALVPVDLYVSCTVIVL